MDLGRSPLNLGQTPCQNRYLFNKSQFSSVMGEMKTIISANIPVSLAQQLQGKTKGTRSRVVTRALTAYLNDKEAFDISDIETRTLIIALKNRAEISEQLRTLLMMELGY